jgi:MFS family permease
MTQGVTYRQLLRGEAGRLAVGLLLLEFVAAVQVFVTATLLPLVSAQLHGERYYGLALSAATVALFVSTPLAIPIAHRVGSRAVLLGSGVLYVAGTLLSATATSMPVFAAGRVVQGLGSGAMLALGYAIVAEDFPSRLRSRMIALLTSMWLLPSLLGPAGAAVLATVVGWRWALLAVLPPLVAAVALVSRRMSGRAAVEQAGAVPLVAVAVMSAGAVAISFAGSRSGGVALGLLAVGLVLVLGGAMRVLPDGSFFGAPPPAAAVGGLLLALFAFFGGDGLITLYVTDGLGASIGWAAAALSAGGVAWSLATLAQPRLLDRSGQRGFAIVASGSLMITLGLAAMLVVLLLVPSGGPAVALVVIAAWTAGGAGMGLVYPTLTLGALLVPAARAGTAAAAVVLTEALGGTLSLAISGSLVSLSATLTGTYRTGLLLSYAMFTLISAAVLYYARRAPARLVEG